MCAFALHLPMYPQPSINLQQHLPNSTLIIYPESGHGAIFQFSELFVREAQFFLNSWSSGQRLLTRRQYLALV
jgi:pimeloyl-ACP methyl ester carboxylesterase